MIQDGIGNTPILKINNFDIPNGNRIFAKMELFNPGGSVKDRVGMRMIADAEAQGTLHRGDTIIEATAGNTGIGIALAALNRGYRVVFVVPLKFSKEKLAIMKALGAEIVHTPRSEGMLGAERKANEIVAGDPEYIHMMKQFRNMSNPAAHYATTGPEIYRDLDGRIDYFVAGAGSGGTFTGVVKYLKERKPSVEGVLADPVGSTIGGGEHGDYDIEGIGNDFIADTMDISLVDKVIKVRDSDAMDTCRELARREGVMAGSSSGAALWASLKLAEQVEDSDIVTIFPDRGERYFSKGLWGDLDSD
ncbi:MAG: cysteine synthase family protein [Candidatus Methanomethylophilus sp.]|nr:cysteine synthase family protein [Methanomethylophilus sp.]MCI2074284.1 cysteine synthase family protein [Methanomethylophilus sp.]MCI2092919.1 cysteine synthase family protein [Methanomethylophilus sp.]